MSFETFSDLDSIYEHYLSDTEEIEEDTQYMNKLSFFQSLKRRVSHGTLNFNPWSNIDKASKLNLALPNNFFKGRRNSAHTINTVESTGNNKIALPHLKNEQLHSYQLGYYQRKLSNPKEFDRILTDGYTETESGKELTLSLTLTPELIR